MGFLRYNCIEFKLIENFNIHSIDEPIGWDGVEAVLKRDNEYYGMNFSYTDGEVLLSFDCDAGKNIIDQQYDLHAYDASIVFQFIVNGNVEFEGELDMKTYERGYKESKAAVKKQDFNGLFKSRFDTKVDLSKNTTIDGNVLQNAIDLKSIRLHSKAIKKTREEYNRDEIFYSQFNAFNFPIQGDPLGGTDFEEKTYYYQLGNFSELIRDELQEVFNIPAGYSDTFPFPSPHFQVVEDGDYEIRLNIGFRLNLIADVCDPPPAFDSPYLSCGENGGWNDYEFQLMLTILDENDNNIFNAALISDTYLNSVGITGCNTFVAKPTSDYNLSFTDNFSLNQGDKIYIYIQNRVFGTYNRQISGFFRLCFEPVLVVLADSTITIEGVTKTDESNCEGMLIHEAFSKTTAAISNIEDAFESEFFGRVDSVPRAYTANGCGAFKFITNGLYIRQFPSNEKPLQLSVKELMEYVKVRYNCGMDVNNNTVKVEPFEYFFKDNELITFDNPIELKETTANDLIFNQITIGYNKWENERVGGLDEFLTKSEYLLPIEKVKETKPYLSPFVASGYAIEFTRRENYTEQQTTDNEYDNERFVISSVYISDSVLQNVRVGFFTSGNITPNFIIIFDNVLNIVPNEILQVIGTNSNDGVYTVKSVTNDGNDTTVFIQGNVNPELSFFTNINLTLFNSLGNNVRLRSERNESFEEINNILDPESAYNMRDQIGRVIREHAIYINSLCSKKENTKSVKHTFQEGNFLASSIFNTNEQCLLGDRFRDRVEDNSNLPLINFNNFTKLFEPVYLEFEELVSYAQLQLIKANPYFYIRVFSNERNTYISGWIMSIKYNPTKLSCKFKLLKRYES